jgi:hypothetical protein
LLIAGPLQPWAFVRLGGLRLPLYGLFGPGALTVIGGVLLLVLPSPGPLLLLAVSAAAWYAARLVPGQMLAAAHATAVIMDSWLDPLNQLLDRFHIPVINLTDRSLPAARAIGPGVWLTFWGASLSAAAAVPAVLAVPPAPPRLPRSCPSCAARLPRQRELRFCPQCGGALSPTPVCRKCGASSEAGDRFCGRCGERLLSG